MKEHDWVDSDNHIIDRNSLKNHTDSYIRQLLTATFDEFFRRIKEKKKRKADAPLEENSSRSKAVLQHRWGWVERRNSDKNCVGKK